MRVLVCPADLGGCGSYRCIWPAEALIAQGYDVTLAPDAATPFVITWEGSGDWITDTEGGQHPPLGERIVSVEHPGYDVVVLQRPLRWELGALIPHLQAHGVKVVVEIDDDFSTIPKRNLAWRACHPLASPERNWDHLNAAVRQADLVTVSTPALARRYGARNARVIRNCVPAWYLEHRAEPHEGLMVGWSGTVANHPGDLDVTRGAIPRALGDARFAVIGDGRFVQTSLGLPDPVTASGWAPIEEYPKMLAQLDVGIVPLDDHAFNASKSALKGLEMASLGVPFVASPRPEYQWLNAEGAGLLARRPREWSGTVRMLLQDEACRSDLAEKGREVAARHTIERNAWKWWEAWSEADRQKAVA